MTEQAQTALELIFVLSVAVVAAALVLVPVIVALMAIAGLCWFLRSVYMEILEEEKGDKK